MKYYILCLLYTISCSTIVAQSLTRRLPNIINHPAINVSDPYISASGRALVYLSDDVEGDIPVMFYTTKRDRVNWNKPVMIPHAAVNRRLTFSPGFALNAKGDLLYVTVRTSGGLGEFDLYTLHRQPNNTWSSLSNMGKPINSIGHEGAPSLSVDGQTLYFMRCETMQQDQASNCNLLYTTKSLTGKWQEPQKLPAYINTGNSQSPRIMPDGETLIFSSNQISNNKGGMDLYMSRRVEDNWSRPESLDFVNTASDDQYVSASSLGRYLLISRPGKLKTEIVEKLFPPHLKPRLSLNINGVVSPLDDYATSSYVVVFGSKHKHPLYSSKLNEDGRFSFYINQGDVYNVAIEPMSKHYTFYTKTYDLQRENIRIKDSLHATILPVNVGTIISVEDILSSPYSPSQSPYAEQTLRRINRLISGNMEHRYGIEVVFNDYRQDTIFSDSTLTELTQDTVWITHTTSIDTLMSTPIDTLTLRDSTFQNIPTPLPYHILTYYHNDRTSQQAWALKDNLVAKGIPSEKICVMHSVNSDAQIKGEPITTSVLLHVLE